MNVSTTLKITFYSASYCGWMMNSQSVPTWKGMFARKALIVWKSLGFWILW